MSKCVCVLREQMCVCRRACNVHHLFLMTAHGSSLEIDYTYVAPDGRMVKPQNYIPAVMNLCGGLQCT
jgi:hypothetical protein